METVPLGSDPDGRDLNEIASLFDAPAYIRRARGLEEAFEHLLGQCRKQREEWLAMPRLRVGRLLAFAGEWDALAPLLEGADQLDLLEWIHASLAPRLRLPPARTQSLRVLARALADTVGSFGRFNERWKKYLDKVDVKLINELRDGYNRYYIVEKACALRSDLLARRGFTPAPPLDVAELLGHFPFLTIPRTLS